jgi:hypothetical protein
MTPDFVIPAKAGTNVANASDDGIMRNKWLPAFAGMTVAIDVT